MTLQPSLERHDCQMLGREFQYVGKLEPVGIIIDYLNDLDRITYPLFDVQVHRLIPGGSFPGVTRPEITVARSEVGLLYLPDPEYRSKIQVIKNSERVIVYTPHVVCRGNFHLGAETRLRDLLSLMTGVFLVMTDASVFPLSTLPAPFPQKADLLILNRDYVTAYHPD